VASYDVSANKPVGVRKRTARGANKNVVQAGGRGLNVFIPIFDGYLNVDIDQSSWERRSWIFIGIFFRDFCFLFFFGPGCCFVAGRHGVTITW